MPQTFWSTIFHNLSLSFLLQAGRWGNTANGLNILILMWQLASLLCTTFLASPPPPTLIGRESPPFLLLTSSPNQSTTSKVRHLYWSQITVNTKHVLSFISFKSSGYINFKSWKGTNGPNYSCKSCWNMYSYANLTLMKSLKYIGGFPKVFRQGYTLIIRLGQFLLQMYMVQWWWNLRAWRLVNLSGYL